MLSIIIPAYNEEKNIRATLEDIADTLLENKVCFYRFGCSVEVIIIDDGSKDKTEREVNAVRGKIKILRYFALHKNRGKGAAIKLGMELARGEVILFMDADNATRINNILPLINVINKDTIAIGSRYMEGSNIVIKQPLIRRIFGWVNIALSNMVLGMKLTDYNCGFKIFDAEIAKSLFKDLKADDFSFDAETLYKAHKKGINIKEFPVVWTDKRETSKVRPLRDGLKTIKSLIRLKCGNI